MTLDDHNVVVGVDTEAGVGTGDAVGKALLFLARTEAPCERTGDAGWDTGGQIVVAVAHYDGFGWTSNASAGADGHRGSCIQTELCFYCMIDRTVGLVAVAA